MAFISMSWVHFPPPPRIVVISHNRDFYAKEKKVLGECSFHSMKMKEANEKTFLLEGSPVSVFTGGFSTQDNADFSGP